MTDLLICTALGLEARALRNGLRERRGPAAAGRIRVIAIGMGPRRAARAAALLPAARALVVAGFGGALDDGLAPGDVFVASEVRYGRAVRPCPEAVPLAGELARAGLPVRVGPLVTVPRLVWGAARRRAAGAGARAVDMESGPLAAAAGGRPFAAVRVIVDAPAAPLLSPAVLRGGLAARRTLSRLAPVLARWPAAVGLRRAPPAAPRPACAGVEERRAAEETIRLPKEVTT